MIVPNPPLVAVFQIPATDKVAEHEVTHPVVYINSDNEVWYLNEYTDDLRQATGTKNFVGLRRSPSHVTSVVPAVPGWRVLTFTDGDDNTAEPFELPVAAWAVKDDSLYPMFLDAGTDRYLSTGQLDDYFVSLLAPDEKLIADDIARRVKEAKDRKDAAWAEKDRARQASQTPPTKA